MWPHRGWDKLTVWLRLTRPRHVGTFIKKPVFGFSAWCMPFLLSQLILYLETSRAGNTHGLSAIVIGSQKVCVCNGHNRERDSIPVRLSWI